MLTFFWTFVPPSGGDFSWKRRGVWSHLVLPPGLFSSLADCGVILQFANADAWCLNDTFIVPIDLGQTMWKHRDLYRALRSRFEIEVKRKLGVILVTPYASTCRPETSRQVWCARMIRMWNINLYSGIPAGDVGLASLSTCGLFLFWCYASTCGGQRPELWSKTTDYKRQ